MAISKRVTHSGKTRWVARYRDHTGKEHAKTFDTQKAAKAFLQEQQRALRRGEWLDPSDDRVTVHDLVTEWANLAAREGTRKDRLFLAANLGELSGMPIRAVRGTHLTAWANHLRAGRPWAEGKPLSEKNVINRVGQIRALFQRAVDDGLLSKSPAVSLKRFPTQHQAVERTSVPTVDEIHALAEAAPRWLSVAIRVAALTGLRSGEVTGLRVEDVDFLRRVVHVRVQSGLQVDEVRPVKSRTAVRDIPISDEVAKLLAGMLEGRSVGRFDRVLVTREGRPVNGRSISVGVVVARRRAGVGEHVHFHGLRHFFASSLLQRGVPLTTVAGVLGHENVATTAKTYAHFMPGEEDRVRSVAAGLLDSADFLRTLGVVDGGDGGV